MVSEQELELSSRDNKTFSLIFFKSFVNSLDQHFFNTNEFAYKKLFYLIETINE